MRRADRLFRLVELLRGRRVVTAAELAERLEVSVRTVYRDLTDLAGSGVPLEGEPGVGYRLGRGFDLPPLMFDEDEVRSLVLGARMVEGWADPELRQAARSILQKVEAMLPDSKRALLRETALFAPDIRAPRPLRDRVGVVRGGVEARRKISFAYEDRRGRSTRRTVRPLGLFFWGQTWALGGWCELREDHRSFLLDRMDAVVVEEEVFVHEDEVTLERFLEAARGER